MLNESTALLGRLPPRARAKLAHLEQRAVDLNALTQVAFAAIEAVNVRIERAQERRPRDEEEMTAMLAEVSALEDEAASKRGILDVRRQKSQAAQQLAAQLRAFVDRPTIAAFEDVEPPDVEIDGDGAAAAVERLREQLVALHVELASLSQAPLTVPELRELARAQIERMAASAAPRIRVERGAFELSFGRTDAFVPGTPASEVAGMLAWLWPDEMLAKIERQIDALPAIRGGISADERARRIGDLQFEMLQVERVEEAVIELAAVRGIEIERRPEASPYAILSITLADVAARAA